MSTGERRMCVDPTSSRLARLPGLKHDPMSSPGDYSVRPLYVHSHNSFSPTTAIAMDFGTHCCLALCETFWWSARRLSSRCTVNHNECSAYDYESF